MSAKRFKFSEEQKQRIKQAIVDLESESSGEIVPFYTYRSDRYDVARWKSALISGLLGAVFLAITSYNWWLPFTVTPLEDAIYVAILMLIGYFAPVIFPSFIRFIVRDDEMNDRVMAGATQVFLEEQIFKTVDRTGVLIYISELEHEVVVLADEGINKKVEPKDWEHVVDLVVRGIKNKKVDEGLVNAIHECKELLLNNGFTVRNDDKNELDDDIRIR